MSGRAVSSESKALLALLLQFKKHFPVHGWSWDNRMFCLTCSFPGEVTERAYEVAKATFPIRVSNNSVKQAAPLIQEIAEKTGGVRANQYLFVAGNDNDMIAYGLWWPWNEQETVSFKVGLLDIDINDTRYQELRDAFGLNDY